MIQISLSDTAIILNLLVPVKVHIVNFVCLLAKQYIYRQRCLSQEINMVHFKRYLSQIESMEKYIAVKNNREYKHYLKWLIKDPSECENVNDFVLSYLQ